MRRPGRDRLLLLSYAEVGGPLQPEGLESTMRDLMASAIAMGVEVR